VGDVLDEAGGHAVDVDLARLRAAVDGDQFNLAGPHLVEGASPRDARLSVTGGELLVGVVLLDVDVVSCRCCERRDTDNE
jgi:hypothetical protein